MTKKYIQPEADKQTRHSGKAENDRNKVGKEAKATLARWLRECGVNQ